MYRGRGGVGGLLKFSKLIYCELRVLILKVE